MTRVPLEGTLRLVVILDTDAARGRDLARLGVAATRGGATMLQLRGKSLAAGALADLARGILAATAGAPLVVNDRLDVALACGAAGCHLGQEDFSIAEARRQAPPGFLLGGSAGSVEEARRAREEGADYLGIGPVRATGSKQDAGAPIGVEEFRRILAAGSLPGVAVGGLTLRDVPELLAAGAAGVAVIGAVLGAPDVEVATRELRKALDAESSRLKAQR